MKNRIYLICVIFALFVTFAAGAQQVHKSAAGLDCSGCHVMHGTDGAGAALGPFNRLLSAATTEALCLACHDTGGGRYATYSATVPAVLNATGQPAAGDFADLGTVGNDAAATANAGTGHNLGAGALALTPAGSADGAAGTGFGCGSCHDAHGTNVDTATLSAYRNLRGIPTGSGEIANVIIRASSGGLVGDVYPLSGNIYGTQGTGLSNFSEWCASCHDNFFGNGNTGSASPYTRHPTSNGTTEYNVTAAYLAVAVGSRYPAEDTASSTIVNTGPMGNDANDSVFCLSCHYAHASPNSDAVRWSYKAAVQASPGSACQQCHDK